MTQTAASFLSFGASKSMPRSPNSAIPNRQDMSTHLAISSAPNCFLHCSHPSHITLARSTSNFRARKNRNRCWSVNRSYPGPGLILSSSEVVGIRFCDSRTARNWVRACCCVASLFMQIACSARARVSCFLVGEGLQVTGMTGEGISSGRHGG